MSNSKIFSKELKEKFEDIDNKLYNLKHSFDLYINYLESDINIPLKAQCLALILNNYFNIVKDEYNKLEEDLGVLL